ncbi:MAG TPA: hypothetical protein PKE03_02355 [Bacteroidales bacterium]|nr:hypothetical protein [Bacteroidales bacterium]
MQLLRSCSGYLKLSLKDYYSNTRFTADNIFLESGGRSNSPGASEKYVQEGVGC